MKAHFEFQQVYNAQIIKRIQILNVKSRNSVQKYVCWKFRDTSLKGTQGTNMRD